MVQVEPFLSHLTNERYCSVNTQHIALNALVFLFREYFNLDTGSLKGPLKDRNSFDTGEEAPLATPQFTGVNEDVRRG